MVLRALEPALDILALPARPLVGGGGAPADRGENQRLAQVPPTRCPGRGRAPMDQQLVWVVGFLTADYA
jgi:hypothetical protein